MKTKGKRNKSFCELGLTEDQNVTGVGIQKEKLQGTRDKSYRVGTLCKCSSNHI